MSCKSANTVIGVIHCFLSIYVESMYVRFSAKPVTVMTVSCGCHRKDEENARRGQVTDGMIWFTSDLHLGHDNIIRYADRPFADTSEMDETIVRNINATVGSDDTLWVLGDVAMGEDKINRTAKLLSTLMVRDVRLILGNHDPRKHRDMLLDAGFSSVSDYEEVRIHHKGFVLCHYPMMTWNGRNAGVYMLHGHIHSKPTYNAQNLGYGLRRYDVGVDANGYRPVSADEIVTFFAGVEVRKDHTQTGPVTRV